MSPDAAAFALFAVAPQALGGVRLRARAGPARDAWLAALRDALPPSMPWLRLPAQLGDDALHGGLDLAATLAAGRPVRHTGVLARARAGVLVAAMAERMTVALAARLCGALDDDDGDASAARGLALVMLDEGIGADEAPPAALLDRVGLHVRLEVHASVPAVDGQALARSRARWRDVQVDDPLVEALVGAAQALGVESSRACWHALCATRIVAALDGRAHATAEDAALAVQVVLAPRATRLPPSDDEQQAPEPPPSDARASAQEHDERDALDDTALAERLVDAARAVLPAQLLALLQAGSARRVQGEAGRSGAAAFSRQRGRPVGAQRGEPRGGARLALIDTLRCAAPWQRMRRAEMNVMPGRVIVQRDDLRVQRHVQRRGTTTIFAIDASGSQAMHRLGEAKGAVELLLADCYARRDRVAVIGFRGDAASLLLAPTRSLVRAKRQLAGLPGGGGTPLARGIDAARVLADSVARGGSTPLVVVLTDGRANINRRGEPGRAEAAADALAAARALAAGGVAALLIDTSAQPAPPAQALAAAMQARYLPLPHAGARAVSVAVRRERGSAGPGSGRA